MLGAFFWPFTIATIARANGSHMQVLASPEVAGVADVQDTARLLTALAPRLNRAVRGQVRPKAGLSMPQFILLRALRHGPLPAGQLAQRFGVSRPTITRTVDGLVKKGLVERRADAGDRRVAMISLTAAGRALHESTEELAEAYLSGLLERLPEGRVARIHAAVRDLMEALDVEVDLTAV
jgi:DNA-binding MarR family transcriptional regulator